LCYYRVGFTISLRIPVFVIHIVLKLIKYKLVGDSLRKG